VPELTVARVLETVLVLPQSEPCPIETPFTFSLDRFEFFAVHSADSTTVEEELDETEEELGEVTEEELGVTEEELGIIEEELTGIEEELDFTEEELGITEEELTGTEEELDFTEEELGVTEDDDCPLQVFKLALDFAKV
jgi:vacuolar-type H+-ATPase subunit I/STV1